MPFGDYPGSANRAPLHEIVVTAENLCSDNPRYATMDVQEFVLQMIQVARYPRRALPRDAMLSASLDYYICMVENGGHAGFVGNSGFDEELRAGIRDGLDRLGLTELAALFAELEAFARTEPDRFKACDWQDPTISELDDRFNALPRDDYFARHAEWIRSWPNLMVVPEKGYRAVIEALVERNRKRRRWWQ